MTHDVHIIGGGLAGSEAAWQLAEAGLKVRISEMRGGGDTFGERFEALFHPVTGANPRRAAVEGFEERAAVQRARFAQRCVLRFATVQPPRRPLPP